MRTFTQQSGQTNSSSILQSFRHIFPAHTSETAEQLAARQDLRDAGFSNFQLERRDLRQIAEYLTPGEHILAGIRGHVSGIGGVLLVATDHRILYLHSIPMYSNFEEFLYDVVSGVSVNRAGYLSSVTLFTKFKTYQVDYVSAIQAERFVDFVESKIYSVSVYDQAQRRNGGPMI